MAEPRLLGVCQHCLFFFFFFFFFFFAGSRIVVGMRGLLSHRMAPSCFDIELTTAFDGWSESGSTAFRPCVRPGGSQHCFCCCVAVSLMNVGLRGLSSCRMAWSCW